MDSFLSFLGIYTGWFYDIVYPINGVGWTINVLLLCYVIYFGICKMSEKSGKDTQGKYIFLVSAWLLVSGACILHNSSLPFFGAGSSARAYGSFAVGLLVYELYERINKVGGVVFSVTGLIIFGGSILICLLCNKTPEVVMGNIGVVTIMIACPIILMSVIYIKPISWLCSSKVFQFFGDLSMSVYLWHHPFRKIIELTIYRDTFEGLIIYFICTIIMAIISHYFLEKS